MADKVMFELVSPEKMLVSERVDMVVIPGAEGNFGVLPGHAPMISSVRPGTIDIYEGGQIVERIFTTGGFAEVTPERCTMLADEATRIVALDRAAAEADLARIDQEMPGLRSAAAAGGPLEGAQLAAAERGRAIARAKIEAVAQGPAR